MGSTLKWPVKLNREHENDDESMDLENFEVYYFQTNPYEPFKKIPLSHLMKYWVKKWFPYYWLSESPLNHVEYNPLLLINRQSTSINHIWLVVSTL